MDATFGQIVLATVSTLGASIGGYFAYRSSKLANDAKKEEQASTILLNALKAEREALEAERARAEALRRERNAATDETGDCEQALREVRQQLEENQRKTAALEKHQRECDQLRREFNEFRASVLSGHTSGSPAE